MSHFKITAAELRLFQKVYATFNPKHLETLRPEARQYIGKELMFQASWKITPEDNETYAGQWALIPEDHKLLIGWVPEEDLENIEAIVNDVDGAMDYITVNESGGENVK